MTMAPFKVAEVELHPGRHCLIEASAGTGKTYNIQHIYLRLILEQLPTQEKPYTVDQILVVTYTEAATAELRDRIRKNLVAAYDALRTKSWIAELKKEEDKIDALALILRNAGAKEDASNSNLINRLRLAIVSFDEAAIFTIHGFCARMLERNAFESGVQFNLDLLGDVDGLVEEVVDDFWRKETYALDAEGLKAFEAVGLTRAKAVKLAKLALSNPMATPLQQGSSEKRLVSISEEVEELRKLARPLLKRLEECHFELYNCLFDGVNLSRSYYKEETWDDNLKALRSFLAAPGGGNISVLSWFCISEIVKRPTKNTPKEKIPDHKFFHECEAFRPSVKRFQSNVRYAVNERFMRYFVEKVKQRKTARSVQTYDDMLVNLKNALLNDEKEPDRNCGLAKVIRKQFPVALIDEFQDTDPVQYLIFETVFKHDDCIFFMIGDPKQSIYKFRGADIFAYIEAGDKILPNSRFTLAKNFRSSGELLNAFNEVFKIKNPFVFEEIAYQPVSPGKPLDWNLVIGENDEVPPDKPFQLVWLEDDGDKMNKPPAHSCTNTVLVNRIVKLLEMGRDGEATFVKADDSSETRPLKEKDIAILVTKHKQAGPLQEMLSSRGVHCVIQSGGNVFDSPEATELYHVLRAMLEPGREKYLKTALGTRWIGYANADLVDVFENEGRSPEQRYWLELFENYRKQWLDGGFMLSIGRFLRKESITDKKIAEIVAGLDADTKTRIMPLLEKDVRVTLAKYPSSERSLTNLDHLVELMHGKEHSEKLSAEELLQWLFKQITTEDKSEDSEAFEMRLESDADALKIMTVHKSKGLQFPIVFCPFLWDRKFTRDKGFNPYFVCHDSAGKAILPVDDSTKGVWENKDSEETLAEQMRLAYVALTRAQYRCTLIGGKINEVAKTGLNYLFTEGLDRPPLEEGAEEKPFPFVGNNALAEAPEYASSSIAVEPLGPAECKLTTTKIIPKSGDAIENASAFKRDGLTDWGVMSYTNLRSHKDGDLPPILSDPITDVNGNDAGPFMDFPGGTHTGSCVHEIFERVEFSRVTGNVDEWVENTILNSDETTVREFVAGRLSHWGITSGAQDNPKNDRSLTNLFPKVCDVLQRTLNTPLHDLGGEAGDTFSLSDTSVETETEMEFFFGVDDEIKPERLNAFFQAHGFGTAFGNDDLVKKLQTIGIGCKKGKGPNQGIMHGLVDLVFKRGDRYYLLDWKTNWLGDSFASYAPPALAVCMIQTSYVLQFYIYTLALHLFLQQRLGTDYDPKHFGGGYYLFLRGMNGISADSGVFAYRPDRGSLDELQSIFGAKVNK